MSKSKAIDQIQNNDSGLHGQYKTWFLDYASYVILERAVPAIEDGLQPVQFHPHGDASIGDALVNMGQKDLLIETQGNWGDVRTGDDAAAPRYIEARLSKFALEVVFNEIGRAHV